jgi:tRNA (guanine-N7-)-methyltransferase
MVSPAMRRYRVRTDAHAALVGTRDGAPIDPAALFGRSAPLRVEIGCGHGEFISQLAAAHPDEVFLGNEWDELRVTKIAHKCNKEGVGNVRVFGGEAHGFLRRLPDACAHRIYILFPDPWPKAGHRRRRLVNRDVLIDLSRIAAPGCRFIFGSDTHNYAMQVLSNISTLPGLWRNGYLPAGYRIDIPTRFPTVFERHKKSEGCTIAYLMMERTALAAPPPLPVPVGQRRPE